MRAFFAIVYVASLLALFTYGMNCYFLVLLRRARAGAARLRGQQLRETFCREQLPQGWPSVTIQLPIFNERYVAERLIEAACTMDYPGDRLQVQVLDDSTDDSLEISRAAVTKWKARGHDVSLRHRSRRDGFKAGALREGMTAATGEFIAIFDADFLPAPGFLKETLPYFSDPEVGMVQTRWGHLNSGYSLLTMAQSIGIDGHFGVEQSARCSGGLFMNFNGTAGVWRKVAIEDAGGWQADTLTEDLDLSYRAQLRGWKMEYAASVVCPAELPVTVNAFKLQQQRWAKGSIQTARKNLRLLLAADLPPLVKVEAALHLTHYLVHPFMLLVVLSSIPVIVARPAAQGVPWTIPVFTLFCLATLGPSSMYAFSQRLLYRDWKTRLRYLPVLMVLGVGISVSNTKAVLEALLGDGGTFLRTPKYGIRAGRERWQEKLYQVPLTGLPAIELGFAVYSLAALLLFFSRSTYAISPFFLIYTMGFFYVFALSVREGITRAR